VYVPAGSPGVLVTFSVATGSACPSAVTGAARRSRLVAGPSAAAALGARDNAGNFNWALAEPAAHSSSSIAGRIRVVVMRSSTPTAAPGAAVYSVDSASVIGIGRRGL